MDVSQQDGHPVRISAGFHIVNDGCLADGAEFPRICGRRLCNVYDGNTSIYHDYCNNQSIRLYTHDTG